jgi:hypothetical protein
MRRSTRLTNFCLHFKRKYSAERTPTQHARQHVHHTAIKRISTVQTTSPLLFSLLQSLSSTLLYTTRHLLVALEVSNVSSRDQLLVIFRESEQCKYVIQAPDLNPI